MAEEKLIEVEDSVVRLYAFYNYAVNKQGEPFATCDECMKKQPIPANCYIAKLADNAVRPCSAEWHSDRKGSRK